MNNKQKSSCFDWLFIIASFLIESLIFLFVVPILYKDPANNTFLFLVCSVLLGFLAGGIVLILVHGTRKKTKEAEKTAKDAVDEIYNIFERHMNPIFVLLGKTSKAFETSLELNLELLQIISEGTLNKDNIDRINPLLDEIKRFKEEIEKMDKQHPSSAAHSESDN